MVLLVDSVVLVDSVHVNNLNVKVGVEVGERLAGRHGDGGGGALDFDPAGGRGAGDAGVGVVL